MKIYYFANGNLR